MDWAVSNVSLNGCLQVLLNFRFAHGLLRLFQVGLKKFVFMQTKVTITIHCIILHQICYFKG